MGGLLYWVSLQRGGDLAQSTASVPITVLLYNGPLLFGFNMPVKELMNTNNWARPAKIFVYNRPQTPQYQLVYLCVVQCYIISK